MIFTTLFASIICGFATRQSVAIIHTLTSRSMILGTFKYKLAKWLHPTLINKLDKETEFMIGDDLDNEYNNAYYFISKKHVWLKLLVCSYCQSFYVAAIMCYIAYSYYDIGDLFLLIILTLCINDLFFRLL